MSKEVADEYASSLADLTVNSKPLINMLTILAEENIDHAPAIVQAVEKHLTKVRPDIKLPVLYLIDSIVKNVGRAYVSLFTQNIVSTFCSVFEKVDERTRAQMFKLRQTWNEVFPVKKLYAVDVRVNSMDPAWPITAPTPTSIHLNPRFLSMAPGPVQPMAPAPAVPAPQSAPSSVAASTVGSGSGGGGSGSEAQQALTEAQMREQLLRKQKELLELQQRKLELELLQTKAKLEDQQRQLQVKEQQRQVEQLLLPSAQRIEENASKVIAPKLAEQKKKTSSNKSAMQVSTAEEVEKPLKLSFDSKSGRDPRLNRQPGVESGNINYSGSNMLPHHVMSEISKSKIANKNPVVSTLNKDPRLGTKDPRLNKLASDISTHPEVSASSLTTTSAGVNPQSTLSSFQNTVNSEVKRKPNFLPISSSTAKSQYPQQRTVSPLKSKKGTNSQVNSKGKSFIAMKTEEGPVKSSKSSEAVSKSAKDEKLNVGRKGNENRNESSPRKLNSSEPSSHPSSPLKSDNHRPPRSEHGRKMLGKSHDTLMEKKEGRKKDNLFKTSSSKSPPVSAKGSPDSKRKRERKKDNAGQRLSPRKSPSLSSALTDKGSVVPRDGESDSRTFKGLKNSRSRNYMRRNQENSRSPSPCDFTHKPLPNSSLKLMPSSDTTPGSVLAPKMMGDVDFRQCQNALSGPVEKIPRLAVYKDNVLDKDGKDEDARKSVPSKDNLREDHEDRTKKTSGDGDIINKDVDLRHLSRSPTHTKKRPSMEKGDPPPTKKSKAEMFDVLFGNEDVDLRQLSTMGGVATPLSSANVTTAPAGDPIVSIAQPVSKMASPSKRDTIPPPPLPPLPLTLAVPAPIVATVEDTEMIPVSLDEKMNNKNAELDDLDRAKLWAKYKEINPDTYKSPLKPSWKAYEGEDDSNKSAELALRASSPRMAGRGMPPGIQRGGFGRSGRLSGTFRRLPGDTRDLLRSPSDTDMRSPNKHLPSLEGEDKVGALVRDDEDDDIIAGHGADLGSTASSLNISIIVAQADEQLKNGNLSFSQYNTLLKQVIHLNEIQKLREAQRREDEQESVEWDSGGESPSDQWELMDKGGKREEDISKRRETEKEDDLRGRGRGKDGRPPGMEGEVPLLGRNYPPHEKPILGMHGDIDERIQPPVGAIVGGLGSSAMDKGSLRSNIMPDMPHQPHMRPPMGTGASGGTPPWRDEGQQLHVNHRWNGPVGGPGQWGHHPGHGPPFPQGVGMGAKTPGDLLGIRRDFPVPPNTGGFVGGGPRWAHPPPMSGPPPFRDEEGVYHHGGECFGGPPLQSHPGHGRVRLRELPPPDRAELAAVENDRMKTINIDGVPREIRFYGDTAIIMMGWDDPRELYFQEKGSRRVTFDGGPESIICSFGEGPREVLVGGRPHLVGLGAPTRELYIDGRWYECHFGRPPMPVDIDNRRHFVELAGPPPQVKVGTVRRTDLVAGKINLIIDARDMVPIFLDAKPQCFEIEGKPHVLRFTHALRYVVINGRQFRVEFGGLPMPILIRDRKHFIRFSVLPHGIIPGYVSIAGMEGGRLPSPRPPPPPPGPPMVPGNVPVDEGPRPINEDMPQDHRRVPFDAGIPEPDDMPKSIPPPHKFAGHEPAMPMIGSAGRGRIQHSGRRPFEDHLRHTRRPSPNRGNLPPHMRHGNSETGGSQPFLPNQQNTPASAANRGPSVLPQGPQLPLELLTSLMPVSVAPASGFSYQVQQDTSTDANKKDSESNSSETCGADSSSGVVKALPGLGSIEINVDTLFQRLVATGILPQAADSSADSSKKEDAKANVKADFSPECLKSRHPGVISAIYTGIQCSSCGVRFPPEQTMKYSQHLDWHFRQNRRDRDSARKAQSRKWYYDVSDWIQFEEMEDLEERAQSWFETQGVAESKDDRTGAATGSATTGSGNAQGAANDEAVMLSVPAGEKAEDQHCAVCREGFEQFYNEEKEEWHLKDAVRFEENTYHPVCYDDYKASLEASVEDSMENAECKEDGEKETEENAEEVKGDKEENINGDEDDAKETPEDGDSKMEQDDEPAKDSEVMPTAEELLKNVKLEPKDDDDEAEEGSSPVTENAKELDHQMVIKTEPGVSSETADVVVKEEPMDSEDVACDEKQDDEEMEEIVEPVTGTVDTTLNVVACSIDGNVEFEDTASVGAPVPGRIKINISKPIVSNPSPSSVNVTETQEIAPPGVDDEAEVEKEIGNEELIEESEVEGKEEMVDEEAQVAPPPPGVGTLRLKPRLVGRKLTELPPVMKGTELSGLCSIM